jgi:hypothetical protein
VRHGWKVEGLEVVGRPYRSAISGRYVTAKYGKSHPKTTVKESKKR